MNHLYSNIETFRLVLAGGILGAAIMGLVSSWVHQVPFHDVVGAVFGGSLVLAAKVKHIF